MRIALLRFSSLGDVVVATAALASLRDAFPDASFCLVTKRSYGPLLAHDSALDVVPLESGESVLALRKRLAAWGPTHVVDLHASLRSQLLRWSFLFSGVQILALRKRQRWHRLMVRLGLKRFMPRRSTEAAQLEVLRRFGGSEFKQRAPRLEAPSVPALPSEEARAIEEGGGLVVLSPAARWATKEWPPEHYGKLSQLLAERGYTVLVQGTDSEAAICEDVVAEAGHASVATRIGLDLEELMVLLKRASLHVSGDTGPMHMARALGVPTLALFGSTSPELFALDVGGGAPLKVVRRELACSPCSLFGKDACPQQHFDCMRGLLPSEVMGEAESLLGTSHPRPSELEK